MNKPTSQTGRKKSISEDEFKKILNEAEVDPLDWYLLLLIGSLGLRVGEAVRLKKENIHLDDNVISIPQIKIRGKRLKKNEVSENHIRMPFTNELKNGLKTYLMYYRKLVDKWGWLFPREDGGFLTVNQAQNIFYKYARKLKIHASIHSLRHMRGFLVYKKKSDIRMVQVVLRHKSIGTSTIYASPTMDMIREALEEEVEK